MKQNTGVFGSRLAVAITSVIVTAVVLMGGIALASVPNNSVTSSKIRNQTIRDRDIRSNVVKSAEIATNAVKKAEIASLAVGADELVGTWVVGSGTPGITNGTQGEATATCPAGGQAISAGFTWDNVSIAGTSITSLELSTGANSATVKGRNDSGSTRTLSARVYCILLA